MNRFFQTLLIIFFFISMKLTLLAQDPIVKNSYFEPQGDNIVIYYDLEADPEEEYEVKLFLLRESENKFIYAPQYVSGDIGEGKFAGEKKKIIWNIQKEFPEGLEGEDFYFEIKADEVSSSLIYYVGGAIVAVGAAVAVILGGGGDDTEAPTPDVTRASPPGRP